MPGLALETLPRRGAACECAVYEEERRRSSAIALAASQLLVDRPCARRGRRVRYAGGHNSRSEPVAISRGFGVHYLPLYTMEAKGLVPKTCASRWRLLPS